MTSMPTLKKKSNSSAFYQEHTYFFNNKLEYFNVKALVRDEFGKLKINSLVCIRIIISGIHARSKILYSESHPIVTNSCGFIELSVGLKNPSAFKHINWMQGPYFMQVIVDGYELMNKVLLSII